MFCTKFNPGVSLLLVCQEDDMAKRRVDELVRSYIVFRNFTRPLGGVKSVPGTPYCVKGFFMQSDNGVFEFTPPSPLIQVRALSVVFYFH